jgi:hypothetical protein
MTLKIPDESLLNFMSNISTSEGCWEWTGPKNNRGYGYFRVSPKTWLTHRLSHSLFKDQISTGNVIMHSCDNPGCVNPAHLSQGTHHENMLDCVAKGRTGQGKKTCCKRGHPFSGENLITRGRSRICRQCKRITRQAKNKGMDHKAKTHCLRGHEFSGDNLIIRPTGGRHCRACLAILNEKHSNIRKAAGNAVRMAKFISQFS